METTNNATPALPVYDLGAVVIINAPKHEAHGMRARITKRAPRTIGQPGDVYTVRISGRTNVRAPYFDTEELSLAPGCEECNFRGWLEMGDEHVDNVTRIERCDTCGTFATDDDALEAAVAAGWQAAGCLSCFSPKCGRCGHCHACADDELRPECTRGEADLKLGQLSSTTTQRKNSRPRSSSAMR